ncbi:sensor histidine kinase [Solimicrobium silvestre]|uniref:Histidine kinase n=1 Tax=Solimicrobium silvestre TaxID=2099400 RepID=A0A2S9GU68_9BURK|nr:histidine kinase [Solimicrobium silvestre]PRC91253.1 Histidine kinase [Solimicrobium silvestre]
MIIKHLRLAVSTASPSALASVIPDCCNIGVIYRVLLATNSAAFCGIWMKSKDTLSAVLEFLDSAMLLETISILSLLMLCGLRKVALVQQFPLWLQRVLCGITPALIASALSIFLSQQSWFLDDFLHASTLQLAILSAFFGMIFQHHFELRSRAFSPALVEAKLQALQARIRPHFLFNSINAVLSLIRTEPLRAETALEDLADLFRVLMRDTRDMSTLYDEVRFCRQYLSIEKIRLGERLKVEWEITNFSEKNVKEAQIASLLLQPLIENAVHHGVEPSEKQSVVTIKLNRNSERIFIVIENPYYGAHETKGNQMALDNIRERLNLLYDLEADFVATVIGNIFQVKLSFPFQKMPNVVNQRDPKVDRRSVKRVD